MNTTRYEMSLEEGIEKGIERGIERGVIQGMDRGRRLGLLEVLEADDDLLALARRIPSAGSLVELDLSPR